jgi:hypothetical protein
MLMNTVRSDGEAPPGLDAFAATMRAAQTLQFRVNDTAGNAVLMTIGIYEETSFVLGVTALSDDFMPTWERICASIESRRFAFEAASPYTIYLMDT